MTHDPRPTKECPYCREEVDARAIKCKHCRSIIPPEQSPGTGGAGGDSWQIAYVGEETWRTGEAGGQGPPPDEVQAMTVRLGQRGLGGGSVLGLNCVPIELCEPGEIVFGHITIPIQKCRWVIVCSNLPPM
jgi:hypothetical protein